MLEALQQGIAPAIILAVYLIINKIIDSKKEASQARVGTELADSVKEISNYISTLTKNIVEKDREKCRNAIKDSMNAACLHLVNFVSSTIINNSIVANKATVIGNIRNIANAEYYNVFSTLSLYKNDETGEEASAYMKSEWIDDMCKDMEDSIYDDKLDKNTKIVSFTNRCSIRFQTYINYINNHIG